MKREMFKEVDVNERKFRIGRLDALTGSYITFIKSIVTGKQIGRAHV